MTPEKLASVKTIWQGFKNLLPIMPEGEAARRTLGRVVANLAIGAGLGGGVVGTSALISGLQSKRQKSQGFQQALEYAPELKANEETLKPFYNSLHNLAPTLARDPVAAASILRHMHEFREVGIPLSTLAALTKAQRDAGDGGGGGLERSKTLASMVHSLAGGYG